MTSEQFSGGKHSTAVKTMDYTIVETDFFVRFDTSGGPLVCQLPPSASVDGQVFSLKMRGGNSLTIVPDGGELIDDEIDLVIVSENDSPEFIA